MNERIQEALGILQEECAEVIVEVSKCRRFGIDSKNYTTDKLHSKMLEQEIGDVLALVDILLEECIITNDGLSLAKSMKKDKLKKWSNLYKDE